MSSTDARLQQLLQAGVIPVLPRRTRYLRVLKVPWWILCYRRRRGVSWRMAYGLAHSLVWVELENPDVRAQIHALVEDK